MEIKSFPELYSIDSHGTRRVWNIRAEKGRYIINHGVFGGKMVVTTRECVPKNVGRSNATTLFEQAKSEAESKWNKKIDEGYRPLFDPDAAVSIVREPVLPMLAAKYDPKKIRFPCSVQPKLDGVRALFYADTFWSRRGKQFLVLDHIVSQLKNVRGILDGELYNHGLSFQELISAVKKKNENTKKVKFVVFDLIREDLPFPKRYDMLKELLLSKDRDNVRLLKTHTCDDEKSISRFHRKFVSEGYEGLIARNNEGGYVLRYRSNTLQKYKTFVDAEFKIVGFCDGEGAEKGSIIFQCECSNGNFSVRPQGQREDRMKMFENGDDYIGKMLTVRYQELTDSGIPRFPVGLCVRDYE